MFFRSVCVICRPAVVLTWVLVCVVLVDTALAAERDPGLRNGHIEILFDAANGELAELQDTESGHVFIGVGGTRSWWSIRSDVSDGPVLTADAAKEFAWSGDERSLEFEWSHFDSPFEEAVVTASVSLPADARELRWRLYVKNLGDNRLAEVRFPILAAIAEQPDEVLVVPVWMGEMAEEPRTVLAAGGRDWEWPGVLSLQCLSLYRDQGPGIFVSTDDSSTYRKRFAVTRHDEELGFEIVHLPEVMGGSYDMPYDCLVGTFAGDWFTVAERYRSWPWIQARAQSSRLSRQETPAWVTDAGLWIWNRGRSENVLVPAAVLEEEAGVPINVFWHWWHGCAYDVGFPEYLPPREGAKDFVEAVGEAHGKDLHAIVYMNQRLWGMTTASWESENAAAYAVKAPDGDIHPEVYNTFTKSPMAAMCMGTSFWRDTYAGLASRAYHDLKVDGIYMDQACASLACYDAAHGHPVGGGTYWLDGFRNLSETIRERCTGIGLAGEGCGEAWLPYLDMMLMLQVSKERYSGPNQWEPIPFFQAVYGGHAVFFGNYSSLTMPPYDELWPSEFAPEEPLKLLDRKFSMQFRLEQARAIAWGQQPTLANFRPDQLDTRPEEIAFFIRLAKTRMEHMDYLQYGSMTRPPELDVPTPTIPMSRLSIYAGQRDGLTEFEAEYPAVIGSAWRARDGAEAVFLVNISDEVQRCSFTRDGLAAPVEVSIGPGDVKVCPIETDGE